MGIFGEIEDKITSGLKDVEQKISGFAHSFGHSIEHGIEAVHHAEEVVKSHIVHSPTESETVRTTIETPHPVVSHPEVVSVNHSSVSTGGIVYTPAMPVRTLGASHPDLDEHLHAEHVSHEGHSEEHESKPKAPIVIQAHPIEEGSIKNEPTQLIKKEMKEGKIQKGGTLIENRHASPDSIAHDLSEMIKSQTKVTEQHKEYANFVANLIRKAEHNPFYQEELKLVAPQIMQEPKSTMHGYVGNPFEIAKAITEQQKKVAEEHIHSQAQSVLGRIQAAIHNVEASHSNAFMINGHKVSKPQAVAMLEQQKQRVEDWESKENRKVVDLASMNEQRIIEQTAENVQSTANKPVPVVADESSTKHALIDRLFHNKIVSTLERWDKEAAHTRPMLWLTHKSQALVREGKEYKKEHKGIAGQVVGDLGEIAGYGGEFIGEHPLEAAGMAAVGAATGGAGLAGAGALGEAVGVGATAGQAAFMAGNLGLMGYSIAKSKNKEKEIGRSLVLMAPFIGAGLAEGALAESIEPEDINLETSLEHNMETKELGLTSEGRIAIKRSRLFGLWSKEDEIPIRADLLGNLNDDKFSLIGTRTIGEEEAPIRVSGEVKTLKEKPLFSVEKEGGEYEVPTGSEEFKMFIPIKSQTAEVGEKSILTNVDVEKFDDSGLKAEKSSHSFLSKHSYERTNMHLSEDQSLVPSDISKENSEFEFTDFYGKGKGKAELERIGKAIKGKSSTDFDLNFFGLERPAPETEEFEPLKLDLSKENKPNIERLIGTDQKDLDFVSSNEPKISKSVPSTASNEAKIPEFSVEESEDVLHAPSESEAPSSTTSTAQVTSSGESQLLLSPQLEQPQVEMEELASIQHAVPEALFREDLENLATEMFNGPSVDTANVGRIAASGIMALEHHNLSDVLNGKVNERVETISPETITYQNLEPLSIQDVLQKPLLDVKPMEKVGMITPQAVLSSLEQSTEQNQAQEQSSALDVLNALTLDEPLLDVLPDVPFEPLIEFDRPSRLAFPHFGQAGGGEGKRFGKLWKGKVFKNKIANTEEFFGNLFNGFPEAGKDKGKSFKMPEFSTPAFEGKKGWFNRKSRRNL